MLAAIVASVHLIAVLAVIVGLLIILTASTPTVSAQDLQAINRVYLLTGIALLIAATAGCVLWLAGGKPVEFYNNNPVFHAKLGLFALLLAIITYTGFRFRDLQAQQLTATAGTDQSAIVVGGAVRRLQKTCIPLILVIPALAWMMARGIGY